MKKSQVLENAVAAAQACLDNPQSPDLNSWGKWNAALLRMVFYQEDQRTQAQSLENLVRLAVHLALEGLDPSPAILSYLEQAQDIPFRDGSIAYQPPFDLTTTHY